MAVVSPGPRAVKIERTDPAFRAHWAGSFWQITEPIFWRGNSFLLEHLASDSVPGENLTLDDLFDRRLVTVNIYGLRKILIKRNGGLKNFEKKGANWCITTPALAKIDEDVFLRFLLFLKELRFVHWLSDEEVVALEGSSSQQISMLLEETVRSERLDFFINSYKSFVRFDDDYVFEISREDALQLTGFLERLRSRKIFDPFPAESITATFSCERFTLQRNPDEENHWGIFVQNHERLDFHEGDSQEIEKFLGRLASLELTHFVSDRPDNRLLEACGLRDPLLVLNVDGQIFHFSAADRGGYIYVYDLRRRAIYDLFMPHWWNFQALSFKNRHVYFLPDQARLETAQLRTADGVVYGLPTEEVKPLLRPLVAESYETTQKAPNWVYKLHWLSYSPSLQGDRKEVRDLLLSDLFRSPLKGFLVEKNLAFLLPESFRLRLLDLMRCSQKEQFSDSDEKSRWP